MLEEQRDILEIAQKFAEYFFKKKFKPTFTRLRSGKFAVASKSILDLLERVKVQDESSSPESPQELGLSREELHYLVETVVKKRIRDRSSFQLLKELIDKGDELVYAAFDVFKSDLDEDDLLDTLERIILNKSEQRARSASRAKSPKTGSIPKKLEKVRFEDEVIDLGQHEGSTGRKGQRVMSPKNDDFSYFLEAHR